MSADLDRLYAVPLNEFIAERDRARRALKSAGRAQEAQAIARLAKPSVPAWVVNQLARRQPALVAGLLDAAAELQRAQRDLLKEKGTRPDRPAYAEAVAAHREALRQLRAAAEELLESSGHAAAAQTVERVMRTLRAAAASEPHRPLLRRGRLAGDVDEPDLSDLIGQMALAAPAGDDGAPAQPATRPPRPAAPPPPERAPRPESEDARAKAEAEERARAREAQEKEKARAEARREEERRREDERERVRARAAAQREVDALRARAATAERALDATLRARDVARRSLAEADAAAESARAHAEELARQLEAATATLAALR